MSKPDFITLCSAILDPESTIEDKNNLYLPFLELEEWIFIMPNNADINQWQPSIINFEGHSWVLLFTDSAMAHNFAKQNPADYLGADGGILYVPLRVREALSMIYDLHKDGLYGMQINFGLPGWYTPVTSVPNIIDYLLRTKTVNSTLEKPELFALSVIPNKPA